MEIVINKCFGGYGLSYDAVMRYSELSGIKLYAFVEGRDNSGHMTMGKYVPYVKGERAFLIHYSTTPLKEDGTYEKDSYWSEDQIERTDPLLIKVVKELRESANGEYAKLEIVEIPDGIEFEIDDYDGIETIHESHRSWG